MEKKGVLIWPGKLKMHLYYILAYSQRIKIFCCILLQIGSRGSFLNTGFRELMRNWKVSRFQRILLRSSTVGIWSSFSKVIKQHMESKHLNILKFASYIAAKISALLHYRLALQPYKTLIWPVTHRKCPALGKTQIYQRFLIVPPQGSHHGEWHERLMPEVTPSLPHPIITLSTQATQGLCDC